MPTFSITLPENELRPIDEEAHRNRRSRTAQVAIILEEWLQRQRHSHEEREVKA